MKRNGLRHHPGCAAGQWIRYPRHKATARGRKKLQAASLQTASGGAALAGVARTNKLKFVDVTLVVQALRQPGRGVPARAVLLEQVGSIAGAAGHALQADCGHVPASPVNCATCAAASPKLKCSKCKTTGWCNLPCKKADAGHSATCGTVGVCGTQCRAYWVPLRGKTVPPPAPADGFGLAVQAALAKPTWTASGKRSSAGGALKPGPPHLVEEFSSDVTMCGCHCLAGVTGGIAKHCVDVDESVLPKKPAMLENDRELTPREDAGLTRSGALRNNVSNIDECSERLVESVQRRQQQQQQQQQRDDELEARRNDSVAAARPPPPPTPTSAPAASSSAAQTSLHGQLGRMREHIDALRQRNDQLEKEAADLKVQIDGDPQQWTKLRRAFTVVWADVASTGTAGAEEAPDHVRRRVRGDVSRPAPRVVPLDDAQCQVHSQRQARARVFPAVTCQHKPAERRHESCPEQSTRPAATAGAAAAGWHGVRPLTNHSGPPETRRQAELPRQIVGENRGHGQGNPGGVRDRLAHAAVGRRPHQNTSPADVHES